MLNERLPVNYLDSGIMGLGVSPDYPIDPTLYTVERVMDGTWQVYRLQDGRVSSELQGATPQAFPTGLLFTEPELLFL
jgi:hypothetical protein